MSSKLKEKIKLIAFDTENVLFDISRYKISGKSTTSTWDIVFHRTGIYSEHERLKEMYINGKFSNYMDWTNEACKILQKNNLKKANFIQIISSIPFMNGIEAVKKLKEMSYKTAVITGSFEDLAFRAKKELGLDYAVAHCRLIFDRSGNLKKWYLKPCDFEGKVAYLKNIAEQESLTLSECAYVGDETNDIHTFNKVGLSIAFNPSKEEVRTSAKVVIYKKDLREILKFF